MSAHAATNLRELQAKHLPSLAWTDVLSGELPEKDRAALNSYFAGFVKPQKNAAGEETCVGCGSVMCGGVEGFLLGGAPDSCTMEWGLVHGECHCSKCGWPARAYHYNIPKDDPVIERLHVVLQYHPDTVSARESEAA